MQALLSKLLRRACGSPQTMSQAIPFKQLFSLLQGMQSAARRVTYLGLLLQQQELRQLQAPPCRRWRYVCLQSDHRVVHMLPRGYVSPAKRESSVLSATATSRSLLHYFPLQAKKTAIEAAAHAAKELLELLRGGKEVQLLAGYVKGWYTWCQMGPVFHPA